MQVARRIQRRLFNSPGSVALGALAILWASGCAEAGTDVEIDDTPQQTITGVLIAGGDPHIVVGVGQTVQLAGKAYAASTEVTGQRFNWTSSNQAVATVDSEGRLTGVSTGASRITATLGAVSASRSIVVGSGTGVAIDCGTIATGSFELQEASLDAERAKWFGNPYVLFIPAKAGRGVAWRNGSNNSICLAPGPLDTGTPPGIPREPEATDLLIRFPGGAYFPSFVLYTPWYSASENTKIADVDVTFSDNTTRTIPIQSSPAIPGLPAGTMVSGRGVLDLSGELRRVSEIKVRALFGLHYDAFRFLSTLTTFPEAPLSFYAPSWKVNYDVVTSGGCTFDRSYGGTVTVTYAAGHGQVTVSVRDIFSSIPRVANPAPGVSCVASSVPRTLTHTGQASSGVFAFNDASISASINGYITRDANGAYAVEGEIGRGTVSGEYRAPVGP